MSTEALVERGEAPVARTASPLWKWAFIATLMTLGAATLAAVLRAELQDPVRQQAPAEHKSRLRFNVADYQMPAFEPPAPAAPDPEPVIVQKPQPPLVPALPRPEPREDDRAFPVERVPPMPKPAAEPIESPEEIARKRRLAAPLGGAGGGSPSANRTAQGQGAGRDRSGLDLSATRVTMASARRLSDLTFIVPKGTAINCILDTAIQSDQAGLVGCTLPRDVYGADGTVVLLDRGSQVLGEYRSATLTYGKRRVFVVWDRVRTPEGVIVDIASPGTGPLGQAGMGGHIDNHYWERVGIPVLMSAVSFGVQSYTRERLSSDQSSFVESTTNDSLSGVLAEFARIKPTLYKHQGDPIAIVVARDLDLSSVYALRRRGHGR